MPPPNTVQPSTGHGRRGVLLYDALHHQLWLFAVSQPQRTVCFFGVVCSTASSLKYLSHAPSLLERISWQPPELTV